jgi:hypothetical protein
MEITVSLPCTAKTYAWLNGRYGDGFTLSEKASDHLFILSQIHRSSERYDKRINPDGYRYCVAIKMPYHMYEMYGSELTLTAIQRINTFVEAQIDERLYPSLDICLKYFPKKRGVIKDTILTFLDLNNLDPDIITFEAIKKKYYRHRLSNSA